MKCPIFFALLLTASAAMASGHGYRTVNRDPFFNVRDFGAKGDGVTLDVHAINNAISAAVKAGGGTVYFPAGNYLTGSIRLHNYITLYLDQAATVIAAPVSADNGYDEEEPGPGNEYEDAGHRHWHNSLIWGDSVHDVTICGNGLINGANLYHETVKGNPQSANKAIGLVRSRNITIKDISILHGGWFGILATGVDNFTVENVRFDTNRDGVDIDCCHNVRIANCTVNSPYDDGICLKSSFALGYIRSTENVTITNCQVSGYDEGSLLDGTFRRSDNPKYHFKPTGRIKFGTESNGGFKNITITNCVFDYCRGLALESVDGANLQDVTIDNITMHDVVSDPVFIRLGSRMRGPAGTPVGNIGRIIISNIVSYNSASPYACTIAGVAGHPVDDISISNVKMFFTGGESGEAGGPAISVPENDNKYPEPGMFGKSPAYGMFIRHAENITLADVEFHCIGQDLRPALWLDDVKGIYLSHISAPITGHTPAIQEKGVTGLTIYQSPGLDTQR